MVKKIKEKYTGPRVTDTETFVKKARWVHGDKYDYSKVDYVNKDSRVFIICANCGVFDQTPGNHLQGNGCRLCGPPGSNPLNTEEFIKRSKSVHGELYNYRDSVYCNWESLITIRCPRHGKFDQRAGSHLKGKGCYKCAGKFLSENEWVGRFRDVHGDRYKYSKFKYRGNSKNIEVLCRIHGSFVTTPWRHSIGNGCPECALENSGWGQAGYYGTENQGNLYVLKLNDCFIKVGLAKEIHSRMDKLHRQSGYSVEKLYSVSGKANKLFELEQKILRKSNLKRFYPEVPFGGQSECLHLSELPKVLDIIEDWEKNQQSEEKFEESP